jgi:hypothetical protein
MRTCETPRVLDAHPPITAVREAVAPRPGRGLGPYLVAIQQMLGHWHVGTTMRYVTPSSTFVEDAYRRAITDTPAGLTDIDDKEG